MQTPCIKGQPPRSCNKPSSRRPKLKATTTKPWNEFLPRLVEAVARSVGLQHAPKAKELAARLHSQQYASAVALADSLSEQQYGEPGEHFAWNQLAHLVRKVPLKDPLLKPREVAIEKFMAAEARCREVNERKAYNPVHSAMIERARRWIEKVIGAEPMVDEIYRMCDFGPGASIGVGGQRTHFAAKLSGEWTVSPSAAPYALNALMSNHQVFRLFCEEQPGTGIFCIDREAVKTQMLGRFVHVGYNKVSFVPKTAKTHRAIAVEPTLNTFIQKGIDSFLRKCLKRAGINLSRQEINVALAKLGSLESAQGSENPLCTLDLSSASDLISRYIVRLLLPPAWYSFLDACRSPSYVLDGVEHRYEKFCSMGNGFCFPLESLIFAALAIACDAHVGGPGLCNNQPWHIYGDDIIVRRRAALTLVPLLEDCGFVINESKSFLWGPFRESCGADFFGGQNVRPYVLDELPSNHKALIKIANGIQNKYLDLSKVALFCLDHIVPAKQFVRPYDGPEEEAITVPLDVFMTSRFARWDSNIQNWTWRSSRQKPVTDMLRYDPRVEHIVALRGAVADSGGRPQLALRQL